MKHAHIYDGATGRCLICNKTSESIWRMLHGEKDLDVTRVIVCR